MIRNLMMFADISGSSALLARIGTEKMVAVLYGAPIAFHDDSERDLLTALAMQAEMAKLNREAGDELGMGLGLARGKVIEQVRSGLDQIFTKNSKTLLNFNTSAAKASTR